MPTPHRRPSPQFLRGLTFLLATLGALDALYLWVYKISNNDKMCLGSGDCATVNYSTYSEIYGIPVALLGLLAYLAIIVILALEPHKKWIAESAPLAIFGIALVGVLFSAYLTFIEFVVIHAVCPFCVISAFMMLFIFIASLIRLLKHTS